MLMVSIYVCELCCCYFLNLKWAPLGEHTCYRFIGEVAWWSSSAQSTFLYSAAPRQTKSEISHFFSLSLAGAWAEPHSREKSHCTKNIILFSSLPFKQQHQNTVHMSLLEVHTSHVFPSIHLLRVNVVLVPFSGRESCRESKKDARLLLHCVPLSRLDAMAKFCILSRVGGFHAPLCAAGAAAPHFK
jgi:hypothetical protein